MSFVIAIPELLEAAAADATGIGRSLSAATSTASGSTAAVIAAAEDEVSAAIASLFSAYGDAFHQVSTQAAAFHAQFVRSLNAAGSAYAAAEAANAAPLQAIDKAALNAVNTPTQMLTGRPLIGDGASATTSGAAGGSAGWLFGNGGNGAAGSGRGERRERWGRR